MAGESASVTVKATFLATLQVMPRSGNLIEESQSMLSRHSHGSSVLVAT